MDAAAAEIRQFATSIDARHTATHDQPRDAEEDNQGDGDQEVVGHGVRPPGRVRQILTDPKQENDGDCEELAGNDQERVAKIATLVELFHLLRGEIPFLWGSRELDMTFSLMRSRLAHWTHQSPLRAQISVRDGLSGVSQHRC